MKLIGFDFDGVIINSSPAMEKAWSDVSDKYSLSFVNQSFQHYKLHVGKPFPVIMQELSLEDYLPDIQADYFAFTRKYQDKISLYAGILDVLNYCQMESSIRTALITSKAKPRTQEIIKFFGLSFDVLLCPEDTLRGKPFADPLFSANSQLSISPSNSIYIGDMESDLLSANAAGWTFCHAGWGYGEISEKRSSQFLTLTNPSQALELISKFIKK